MEFTKEMFVVLAKTMSEDKIIEKMEEAINEYKEAKLINQNINKAMETLKIATHLFIMNSLDKDPMEINFIEIVVRKGNLIYIPWNWLYFIYKPSNIAEPLPSFFFL